MHDEARSSREQRQRLQAGPASDPQSAAPPRRTTQSTAAIPVHAAGVHVNMEAQLGGRMGSTKRRTKQCLYCGEPLPDDGRPSQKYCKPSHRTLAFRARRSAEVVDAPEWTPATNSPIGEVSGLPASVSTVQTTLAHLHETVSSMNEQVVADVLTLQQTLGALADAVPASELKACQQRLAEREAELAEVRTEGQRQLEHAVKREQAVQTELEAARCRLAERDAELERIRVEARQELEQTVKREQVLREATEAARLKIEASALDLRRQLAEANTYLGSARRENAALKAQLASANAELTHSREAQQRLQESDAEQQQRLATAQALQADLEAKLQHREQEHAAAAQNATAIWLAAYQRNEVLQAQLWSLTGLPLKVPHEGPQPSGVTAPQTNGSWSNPLIPFVVQVLERIAKLAHFVVPPSVRTVLLEHPQEVVTLGLLMTQAQLAALLVPAWADEIRQKPKRLARAVIRIVNAHADLYPIGVPDFAEQNEELMTLLAEKLKEDMKRRLITETWQQL